MSEKIDYENWDENEEENLKKAKEAVVLDINGKIDMSGYEDEPSATIHGPETEEDNSLEPADIINPENALSNKDNVPSSGIIFNTNAMEKAKALREKKIDNAFKDPHFPDIVHFQMLNDCPEAPKIKEEIDAFYDAVNDLMKDEDTEDSPFPAFRDIPPDYELYDGILFYGKYELFLNCKVEDNEIYEIYLTIEKDDSPDLSQLEKDFEPEGASSADASLQDLEGVEGVPEPLDKNAFLKYVLSEDKLNCRTLPLSFIEPYIKKFGFEDWTGTIISASDDPYADFDKPIRVKH